jgi:hypothetical protein
VVWQLFLNVDSNLADFATFLTGKSTIGFGAGKGQTKK